MHSVYNLYFIFFTKNIVLFVYLFRDAMMISVINCATSVFAGFVIFSTLGFMAKVLNKDITKVAASGTNYNYIANTL